MRSLAILVLCIIFPIATHASWDDIESDVNMMNESANDFEERQAEPAAENPRYKSTPPVKPQPQIFPNTYTTSNYTPPPASGQRKPSMIGVGVKLGTGSGTYVWEYDDDYWTKPDDTGIFGSSQYDVLFSVLDDSIELTYGSGAFNYPSGGARSYSVYGFAGNFGKSKGMRFIKANNHLNVYGKVGMEALSIDYSDIITTSTILENSEPVRELRWILGGGVGYTYEIFEVFAEYTYHLSNQSSAIWVDQGHLTEDAEHVSHNEFKLAYGVKLLLSR